MSDVIRNLGQGLVLRRGRAADAEALAAFNADVLRPQDATEPNATMAAWTRDLFTGHPTFTPDQATVVESAEGNPAGLLTHAPRLNGTRLDVTGWELKPGISWRAVWFPLLAYAGLPRAHP